jgi:hypothetical protein
MRWNAQFLKYGLRQSGEPSVVPFSTGHDEAFARRNRHLALRASRKVLCYCSIRTEG